MFLTRADITRLPDSAFESAYAMILAVSNTYACGISIETAARIIADFNSC